uniref:Variant surface glycoprotein 1125.2939 n=1 Tax=Trypanosoma brucei TaxID=5691 RepID=A0A1J0R912_9TRYP|nr:variant surface glycoprotein 1125.2939 [Trypanosoma brucei]
MKLAKIALEAKKVKTIAAKIENAETNFDKTTQEPALKTAILVAGIQDVSNIKVSSAFAEGSGGERTASCTPGSCTKQAKTLVAQLDCLCHADSSKAVTAVCTKKVDGSTAWNHNSGTIGDEDIRTIAQTCPSGKGKMMTPTHLRTLVENVRNLVHQDGAVGYSGDYEATGCTSSSGSGVCIKLGNYNEDPPAALNKLGCQPVLEHLADNLDKRISHNKQMTELKSRLQKAKEEAISCNQKRGGGTEAPAPGPGPDPCRPNSSFQSAREQEKRMYNTQRQ